MMQNTARRLDGLARGIRPPEVTAARFSACSKSLEAVTRDAHVRVHEFEEWRPEPSVA